MEQPNDPRANASGLRNTSHRPKGREAGDWTGRSPKSRWHPYNNDHHEHILFLQCCWVQGDMTTLEEFLDILRDMGYSQAVIQSMLAQATHGMPGGYC